MSSLANGTPRRAAVIGRAVPWLLALGLVEASAFCARRWRRVLPAGLLLLVGGLAARSCGSGRELRIATFNIQEYGRRHTDDARLTDHVAVTKDFPARRGASVAGYCAALACRSFEGAPPPDFASVSDHCPIIVGGR